MTETILLTGGAGFIGSNFLSYMYKKYPDYKFIVLDNFYTGSKKNIFESNRIEVVEGDIVDTFVVNNSVNKATMVVHFAALLSASEEDHGGDDLFRVNLQGTEILLRALLKNRNNIKRFINISSSSCYGSVEDRLIRESDPLLPISLYGASKTAADRLAFSYFKDFDLPIVTTRLFNNFGPRQIFGVVPKFIKQAMTDQPIHIHGDGEQRRDWLFVSDTVRAFDLILHRDAFDKLKGEEFNLGSEKDRSVNDVANAILEILGKDPSLVSYIKDIGGQVRKNVSNSNKALNLLNWKPEVSFEEGLRETILWHKSL